MQTSAAVAVKPRLTQLIPIEKIKPSKNNARKEFAPAYIAELAASVDRDGLQQPPKVRPVNGHFELVYGECRVRAHDLLGKKEVECFVEQMDDLTAERIGLLENIKRRDLTVFEEARELKRLHEVQKLKIEDLAQQVGIAVRTVRENIKLAAVAPAVQALVVDEKLKLSLAKLISRLPKADDQVALAKRAVSEQMTHDELERLIREEYMADLRAAPFDVKQKSIPCIAESCSVCPRNAKNMKDELPDFKGGDTCTALDLYRKKVIEFARAHAKQLDARYVDGAKLFDRWGDLDKGMPYVRADALHPKDPKSRPWRELISKEELKKRLVVVVSPKNEVMDLLDEDGIELAVKAEGKLKKPAPAAASSSGSTSKGDSTNSREQSEKDYQTLLFKQRVTAAVIAQLVAKMTKWPKVEALRATARQQLREIDFDWHAAELGKPPSSMPQRRGWTSPEAAEKAIDKMKENEVLTLIWESTFDWQMNGVTQGNLSSHLLDFAKMLGIDVKKTEAAEKCRVAWVDNIKPDMEIAGIPGHTNPQTAMVGLGRVPYSINVNGPNDVSLFLRENGQWFTPETYKTIQHARSAAETHTATGKLPPGEKKDKPAPKAKAKKGGGKR